MQKKASGFWQGWWTKKEPEEMKPEEMKPVEVPIKIIGNRSAGKTTFLYKIYFKYVAKTPDEEFGVVPTESSNVEPIPYKDAIYQIWEFPEMEFAANYIKDTKVLIYVLDSAEQSKPEVFDKAKKDIQWLLETYPEDLRSTIIITVANKQDMVKEGNAVGVQELGEMWMEDEDLRKALDGHQWRIFACSASQGEGVDAVLEYVYQKACMKPVPAESSTGSVTSSVNGSAKSSIDHGSSTSLHSRKASVPIAKEAGSATLISSYSSSDPPSRPTVMRRSSAKNEQAKFPVTPWEDVPNPYHLSDDEFLSWFDQGRTFLFFDHHSLVRVAYLYLRRLETSTERRSDATRRLLYCLRTILRSIELHEQDVQNEVSHSAGAASRNSEFAHDSIIYSETHALFWLHMVSYSIIKHPVLDGEGKNFDRFLMRSQELWDGELWRLYYTPKTFNSEKAQNEFTPPDKKPMPNAFKPASVVLKGSGLNIDYKVVA